MTVSSARSAQPAHRRQRRLIARMRRLGGPILRAVRRPIRRRLGWVPPPPERQIVVATYHRSGSSLIGFVFERLCREFEWSLARLPGRVDLLPEADVVILQHGMCTAPLDQAAAVQVTRDPRDVVVSGYDYHQRTNETWCTNVPDPAAPLIFPQIDRSQEHRPETWKRAYIDGLDGRSYQEVLASLPRPDGIQFEIERYASWTAEAMHEFRRLHPGVPVVRFESIMADFDEAFLRLFRAVGIGEAWLGRALAIAREHDIARQPSERVAASVHTANRGQSRWERELDASHRRMIQQRLGEAIAELGYEADSSSPMPGRVTGLEGAERGDGVERPGS